MKLTGSLLLLAAVVAVHAAEKTSSRSKQKNEEVKTDKRELAEGNAAIEKRAPVLPTALPSVTPGIEYADSKDSQSEKSPAQQIYATPLPQIAKISDLLSGQGPPFQAAIASHLFAPVSVYQPRLGAPTTYEVSNPIPSQLAYSEHKISYQPPQNAIQYSQPIQYNQKLQAPKQQSFARPINFQPPYQQQIFVQPQPIAYTQQPQAIEYAQQPHLLPIPQPIYQHIPQVSFQVQRPIQYTQNVAPQHFVQQPGYSQEQQTLVQIAPQPGITYSRQEQNEAQNQEQSQRQLKSKEQAEEQKPAEKQAPAPEKNYNGQPQGAISYASFSQSQPTPSFAQPSRQQYQTRPQYQAQPQYQTQQVFHHQPQPQPAQYQYELQPQVQYQAQHNPQSKLSQESIATAATKSLPVNPIRPVLYFRPGPSLQPIQAQHHQAQYPHEQQAVQNQGAPQHYTVAPSFPPVQYFGKFAHSIFGGQH